MKWNAIEVAVLLVETTAISYFIWKVIKNRMEIKKLIEISDEQSKETERLVRQAIEDFSYFDTLL